MAQAFYDAALADRLVAISEEAFGQASRAYDQTKAKADAGRVSEFELLRAQVDRDTQRSPVVRAGATRDVAYLRLKQLLDLPLGTPIQLAAQLDDPRLAPAARFATRLAEAESSPASRLRSAVTQADYGVQASEAAVVVADAQRKPAFAVQSAYGIVNYHGWPGFDDWRQNWTVGLGLQIPILTGGRIKAEQGMARADVDAAKARLQLTKELSDLDDASSRASLGAARAEWEASGGVVQQAARAYGIAELRFREGLSTQLELSDARLLLAQAQVNRSRAARDLQMTRVRLALLPELPLGVGAGAGTMGAEGAGAAQGSAPNAAASSPAQASGSGEPRDRRPPPARRERGSHMTRHAFSFVAGSIVLTGALLASACGKSATTEASATTAPALIEIGRENVVEVTSQAITVGPLVSGELKAEREATVRAEVGGAILQVLPREGEAVKVGTLLARIDGKTIQDAYASAQSGLRSAEQTSEWAQKEATRIEALVKGGALAERDAELARNQATQAKAAADDARSRVTSVRKSLDDLTVRRRSPASSRSGTSTSATWSRPAASSTPSSIPRACGSKRRCRRSRSPRCASARPSTSRSAAIRRRSSRGASSASVRRRRGDATGADLRDHPEQAAAPGRRPFRRRPPPARVEDHAGGAPDRGEREPARRGCCVSRTARRRGSRSRSACVTSRPSASS